jgi:hypothetical protein
LLCQQTDRQTDRQKGLPKLITEFFDFFSDLTGNAMSKRAVLNGYEEYGIGTTIL